MSTGLNCALIEVKPGRWYYLLEDWDSPKGGFDWREHATAYGPFETEDDAVEHLARKSPMAWHSNPAQFSRRHGVSPRETWRLDDNHANPGGWSRSPYEPGSSRTRCGRA